MKIKFVNGKYRKYNENVIDVKPYKAVSGYFQATWDSYRWWRPNMILSKRELTPKIVVVRQNNVLHTVSILAHELAHAFVYKFLTKSKDNKYNRWIDRNQMPEEKEVT